MASTPVDVLVVGAGFAGLCAAIKLHEAGERDVVVVERSDDVGGTWRDNTYPGAACDVPSQLYSFSFAPNDWSRSYSFQPEIQEYLRKVARESGVMDRFEFEYERRRVGVGRPRAAVERHDHRSGRRRAPTPRGS